MSSNQECYRYAAPGERASKRLSTGGRAQQVRYLPRLEVRSGSTSQPLLVLASGHSRLYRDGNQTQAHFNLSDRLGSVSRVADASGKVVSQETWYPFGGTASWLTAAETGAAMKFQRYVGKERDVTGLILRLPLLCDVADALGQQRSGRDR